MMKRNIPSFDISRGNRVAIGMNIDAEIIKFRGLQRVRNKKEQGP